jgi:general secretion pathway protein G
MTKKGRAFTLIELLVVIALIIILAGLVLSTVGYVQKKGARSRAEAEIAAISAALESYKADNGIYPSNTDTDSLDPAAASINVTNYGLASVYLYKQLSGDTNANRQMDVSETGKSYFAFKPNQLSPTDQTQAVTAIRDPFGNSYGYSTAKATTPSGTVGNNPTFDLWSTAGATSGAPVQSQWIKNW